MHVPIIKQNVPLVNSVRTFWSWPFYVVEFYFKFTAFHLVFILGLHVLYLFLFSVLNCTIKFSQIIRILRNYRNFEKGNLNT
jgi:hypothetical protein